MFRMRILVCSSDAVVQEGVCRLRRAERLPLTVLGYS